MIWMFLIPVMVAALFLCVGAGIRIHRKARTGVKDRNTLLVPFIPAFVQMMTLLLLWLLHHFFMAGSAFSIPLVSVALLCLVTTGAVFLQEWYGTTRTARVARRCMMACTAVFLLEVFGFNGKSLTLHHRTQVIPASDLTVVVDTSPEGAEPPDTGNLEIRSNSVLEAGSLPDWTKSISLQLSPLSEGTVRIKMLITDDNFQKNPQLCGHKLTTGQAGDIYFPVRPYGTFRSARMEFFDMGCIGELSSITCTDAIPFTFSGFRFCLLTLLVLAVIVIREYRFHHVVYDHRKKSHALAVYSVICLCVLSVFAFWIPEQELVSYPDAFDVERANAYEQTFDAFQSGHAWLNVEVDPELMELDGLFDRMLRDEADVDYQWDHAYYDGKYYSYFGIAPVVTFYYPVYWLTGKLPTMAMTCFAYAPFTILFLCMALLASVRLFCKKPNFLLLLLSMPVMTGLCGVYYCLQFPSLYDVVVASGLCFLSLSLWSGMQAYLTQTHWKRCILFAVCAIGCVLCVQSRPSMALTSVVLAPLFVGVLRDKNLSCKTRLIQAGCFAVPLVIGAGATMYYNALRFSSPLDFGATYQLTISNIHANHVRLIAMPAAIYHYLLQPLTFRSYFPFFTVSYQPLDNYQMYNNLEHTVGAFIAPCIALAMLLLPKTLRSGTRLCGKDGVVTSLQGRMFLILIMAMTLLTVWVDFCMGGVSLRYSFDFMPILAIGVGIILLSTVTHPERYVYKLAILSLLLTFGLIWLLLVQFYVEGSTPATIMVQHPSWHEILANALLFWE